MKNTPQSLKKTPTDWKAHFRLAFAHYFYDDRDAAIESFKEVLQFGQITYGAWAILHLFMAKQKITKMH